MRVFSGIKNIKAGLYLLYKQYISPLNKSGYGRIGEHSVIKNNTTINKKNVFIGDYCIIQDQINFISNKGKLIVGKYSVVSSGCTVIPGSHLLTVGVPFYISAMNHINDDEGDIIIEEDCWIGAGCILLPKCHVGRGAVVGAGSVVKKNVLPYAVVVGSPARIIATKFTKEEIIKHEQILYPPEERMTISQLNQLFEENYQGLRSIGVDYMGNEDKQRICSIRDEIGMNNFSNL